MMVTFISAVDSISERGVVCFVGKPGGYSIPRHPEDVGECIREAFSNAKSVEVTYDDKTHEIADARPGKRL